jgi:hypothetical protein
MAKAVTCGPYVPYRDGRPRFVPGPRERDLGFAGQDLKHESGAWFTFEEARAWAAANTAAIAARRAGAPKPATPTPADRSLAALLDDWLASPKVKRLAQRTQDGYRKQVDAIRYRPQTQAQRGAKEPKQFEPFARAAVAAIGAPECEAFVEYQIGARGHHMALASRAVLVQAFRFGRTSTHWRLKDNPAAGLSFERPDGRIEIISFEEFNALVAAADAMDRASIGDALYLGLFTGQRQTDRLAMKDEGQVDGRRMFRQSKTGALVPIKDAPALAARLAAAKARVAAIKLAIGTRPETIVVDETTGREYNEHTYRHVFADVRAAAAATVPSVGDKRDQDIRDTCVTMLFRAGCDALEICDITGHSYKSVQLIKKHYLGRDAQRADAAIDKLAALWEREGKVG